MARRVNPRYPKNEIDSIQGISNINEGMKKFLLVIMALSFLLCACSSDDNDAPQKEEEKEEDVRYYVKYEVTAKTQHINPIKTIKFTTEEGSKTIELTGSLTSEWEATYGPVSKDFVAQLECSVNNYNYSQTFHARIYICRDKEPFVIKAEDEDKTISLKSR